MSVSLRCYKYIQSLIARITMEGATYISNGNKVTLTLNCFSRISRNPMSESKIYGDMFI